MKSLRRDWNHFWFAPLSSVPLGLFRLVFGALVLAYGLLLYPERFLWFSNRGVLRVADALLYNGAGQDAMRLNPLALPSADYWLTPFFVVFLLAGLGLTLGFWTRAMAVIVYLCLNALHARDSVIHNSGDTVMMVMSAYLVLSPAGAACSVDRLWRIFQGKEADEPPRVVPWAQRMMQIQTCLVYLCATFSKITGQPWDDGTAAYYPLHLPETVRFPMLGQDNLIVINLITWGTMIVEFSLATFVWVPRLRLYVLAAGVGLHLGIEYTMNIPLFSFLMIASYITFLTGDDIRNFLAWAKRPLALTPLRLVYDGECDFCKSSLLVVRFLDVFRQITFLDAHDPIQFAQAGAVRAEDAAQAAIAVTPRGRQYAGFDAFRLLAWQLPATVLLAPFLYIPPIPPLGRRAYRWIAANRSRLPVAPRYSVKRTAERETAVKLGLPFSHILLPFLLLTLTLQAHAQIPESALGAPTYQRADVAANAATLKKDFRAHFQAAQQAERNGLFAKAAREYTAAWDGFEVKGIKIREDAGLKAAHLWAERVQTPAESARILNYIIAHPQNLTVLEQAKDLLNTLQPALDQVYQEKLKASQDALAQGQTEDALKALSLAAQAKPDSQEVHLSLARVYAKQNDFNHTTQEITAAVKIGTVKAESVLTPEYAGLLLLPQFQTFIGNALGPDAETKAKARAEMAHLHDAGLAQFAKLAVPGQPFVNPIDGAQMLWIPPGSFPMGDDDMGDNPRHMVTLSGYWMYKNDVTVAMYRKFCEATGRQMAPAPSFGWQDDHPIVNVTWDDAKAYCDWAGVHLPTEAQWEKAARGTDGRQYPWGNDWDKSRLCEAASSTAPVGSYPSGASPYGCLDMAGNVWQWCADWYGKDYWKSDHGKDPTGPSAGDFRVLRGGSWYYYYDKFFRAAYRLDSTPVYWYYADGFRGASGP